MREEVIFSLFAGINFGIANVILKIALLSIKGFSIFSLEKWLEFIFSHSFLGLAVTTTLGTLLFFYSLMKGRVAIVNSITSSSATAIPVVIGIFFLDESISLVKIITITILLAGIFILAKWGKIKTDILTIAKELVK